MFKRYKELSVSGRSVLAPAPDKRQLFNASFARDTMDLHDIILGAHVDLALDKMEKDGVLGSIIPGIDGVIAMKDTPGKHRFKDLWDHTRKVVHQSRPILEVRWAALFHDFGKPETFEMVNGKVSFHNHEKASVKYFKLFAKSFKIFTPEQYNKISFLIYNLGYAESYESNWSDSAVRRFGKEMGDNLEDMMFLSRADLTTENKGKKVKILNKSSEFKRRIYDLKERDAFVPPLPKGIGNAIMELGVQPGRNIKVVKSYLEKLVEVGTIESGKDIEYYMEFLDDKVFDIILGDLK